MVEASQRMTAMINSQVKGEAKEEGWELACHEEAFRIRDKDTSKNAPRDAEKK